MATLQLGSETDRDLRARLRRALEHAGARRMGQTTSVVGSQEIIETEFEVAGHRLMVEEETYVGVQLVGDVAAIEALKRHL